MSTRGILILVGIFALAFLLLWIGTCGYRKVDALQSLENASAEMRRQHPGVSWIRPEALRLLQESGAELLLVDVREEEEFAVSRLPGARRFESVSDLVDFLETGGTAPGTVVVYGAIGFRSASFADRLRSREDIDVVHLEGGIFAWANQGRPLEGANGEPATRVHPYNRIWGRLLDEERRAPVEGE